MRCKINWYNYITNTLNESHELYDNLSFEKEPSLPFIIKACKLIQSKILEKHQNSIFVIPEAGLSSCIIAVINAISCILSGRNKGVVTNLEDFEPNTKIQSLGCTVLFNGVESRKDGTKYSTVLKLERTEQKEFVLHSKIKVLRDFIRAHIIFQYSKNLKENSHPQIIGINITINGKLKQPTKRIIQVHYLQN